MKKQMLLIFSVLICLGALSACGCRHVWTEADCQHPKTCAQCGETAGPSLAHRWWAAACETPETCEACGETRGDALGHTWAEATCDTPKTCTVCGKTEGAALGHRWTAATCEAPAVCTVCGKIGGDALGHRWEDGAGDPKCCQTCGKLECAEGSHVWNPATCLNPQVCDYCDLTQEEPLGHSLADGVCAVCQYTALSPEVTGENATAQIVLNTARQYLGVPYVWAGETPDGFDCSGFVQYVFNLHGITLPRNAFQQYRMGTAVSTPELQPGDLVFFGTDRVSHMGIYIGDGQFLHCSTSRGVTVTPLSNTYWAPRYIGARRVL